MNNFTYSVPTVIHFGKGQISHLSELKESGSRVLMVYGGGSIKKNGIYDAAVKYMGEAGLEVFELGGVTPNPRVQLVREGIEICKKIPLTCFWLSAAEAALTVQSSLLQALFTAAIPGISCLTAVL